MKKLILASASVRRRDILYNAGYSFDVIEPKGDESTVLTRGLKPYDLVMALAKFKGDSVGSLVDRENVVLAADTIVYLDGKAYGKPADKEEAFAMLKALSGKTHEVYTGVFIIQKYRWMDCFYSMANVHMAQMSDYEIESYIENCRPFDKAGGYGIQGPGAVFVLEIRGDFFTICGLPITKVYNSLKRFDVFPVFKDTEYI